MAATIQIREKNGAGQTNTDKTAATIRFKKADNATVDLANPLVVPAAATEYSYQKWLRLHVSAGAFTEISNLRVYSDGGNGYGAGTKLWAKTASAYATPAFTAPPAGFAPQTRPQEKAFPSRFPHFDRQHGDVRRSMAGRR